MGTAMGRNVVQGLASDEVEDAFGGSGELMFTWSGVLIDAREGNAAGEGELFGGLFEQAERLACDLPGLRRLGGFMILVCQKE